MSTGPGKVPRGTRPELLVALVAVAGYYLTHSLTWDRSIPALWSPSAGLAVVLIGWFGPRFAAGVIAGSTALLFVQHLTYSLFQDTFTFSILIWLVIDALLGFFEAGLAWWLFHIKGRGQRRLSDPRSAMQFVLLVPGVCAGLGAALRLLFASMLALTELASTSVGMQLAMFWLDRALGILILAPPLLVVLTPVLKRYGLVRLQIPLSEPFPSADARKKTGTPPTGTPRPVRQPALDAVGEDTWLLGPRLGDWIEILGLTISTSVVCLILSRLHGRELMGWQLWGVQLLLLMWASVRQGLPGGTLTAAAAAIAPLVSRQLFTSEEDIYFLLLLQAHLVALCSSALLVAAASTWVRMRETGYRQVAAHVPIVIYSARFLPGAPPSPGAEITLVSAASDQLLDCPAEQLLGDYGRWLSRIHEDDQIIVVAAIEQLARQDSPVTCEYRLASHESVRWLRDVLAPQRDDMGRLSGWEGVVTDITEQRLLADDLRRTTSMFHALVSNLPTGVFFFQGPRCTPLVVNTRARQLLGSRENEVGALESFSEVYRLFRADGSLYPVEELPVYLALTQGRTTMRDDIIIHRADGRRIPLVSWAAPVVLGSSTRGAGACAVWVVEDLTALHQAEAARKDSERRLRAIIETMAEGLLVLDTAGTIISCNPAACSFFAVQPEQLRGRSLNQLGWQFLYEDGSPLVEGEHPAEQAARSARPVRNVVLGVRTRSERPDDPLSSRWLLANAMPFGLENSSTRSRTGLSAQGTVSRTAGVVLTFSDITASLRARETKIPSDDRFRTLLESLPVMVARLDRDMQVTYTNAHLTVVTGFDVADIADPEAWLAKIHPDDASRAEQMVQNALAGRSDRGELRYRAKDGSEKVLFSLIHPMKEDGVVVGATSLMIDVTREKQLEKELHRGQRLELMGQLASGVAHDFNNLLAVVLTLTQLVQRHLPSDHAAMDDLQRITVASKQASGLAAQLMSLSRACPPATTVVDLNALASRTMQLLRSTLVGNLEVEMQLTSSRATVLADESQIQQVLMNLCLNARDAMPGGGKLLIRTSITPSNEVCLTVADSGVGIREELRDRIFEPFFTTKENGSGLGLAVVQQVVESYRGRIEVHSPPGEGTRFEIYWPLA